MKREKDVFALRRPMGMRSLGMMRSLRLSLLPPFVSIFAGTPACKVQAQNNVGPASAVHVEVLPNGIRISADSTILQVTALRDDE